MPSLTSPAGKPILNLEVFITSLKEFIAYYACDQPSQWVISLVKNQFTGAEKESVDVIDKQAASLFKAGEFKNPALSYN